MYFLVGWIRFNWQIERISDVKCTVELAREVRREPLFVSRLSGVTFTLVGLG